MKTTLACLLFAAYTSLGSLSVSAQGEDRIDYLRQIKPLLAKRCFACHGPLQQKNGLRLDTAGLARRGGQAGAAIQPGKPDESLLLQVVTGAAGFRMPPEGEGAPLSDAEIALLRSWIQQGAPGPADEQPESDPREYWSYRPATRQPLPTVPPGDWPLDPLDALVAAEHSARGLQPVPSAPAATWLRRVWLDLVGVLPPREAVDAFLTDDAPDARERVVDALLAHPFFGQRWGRHWMDVWRYSDWYGSRGINEIRYSQRHIWRWRDWIVDSNNQDLPYDRMIQEMLAGDELAPSDPDVLRATGFIGRNWYKFDRNVWMFDAVEHTAQAFLGLTIRCSRCHDHKYDPISQEDYYRFRAFFEPHDVRTDVASPDIPQQKDATLGMVPSDGVARVFDKQLDAPTYVFQRGDNRYPDEKRPMTPGVPPALGGRPLSIAAVTLPVEAFYPALRPAFAAALLQQARAAVAAADAQVEQARRAAAGAEQAVQQRLAEIAAGKAAATQQPEPSFRDDFAQARPDDWQVLGGTWVYENGRLVQKSVQNFATMVARHNHPRDFRAKLRYRALAPGTIRSIGISFDYVDPGNSQDVYTSTNDTSQSVQAFHRLDGQQVYPPAGIVKTALKVGDETTLEFAVQGTQLTIWLNGTRQLDYTCPVPRRDGRLALWVHDGSAEFLQLEVRPLVATLADLRQAQQAGLAACDLALAKKATALAEFDSVQARLAAERARYAATPPADAQHLATAASRAERQVAVAKAEEAVLQAEQQLAAARAAPAPAESTTTAAAPSPAITMAEQRLTAAKTARDAASRARDEADGKYAPLGEQFPATSSGRRLALARWIADRENPRTARIAVNHVWLRHFGQALVPSVANFGLNGDRPSHPALLDRLAVDLADSGWSLKSLHRRIVLSRTYALDSAESAVGPQNRPLDPTNRFLWHMNSRRMEAEAVRDSLLFAAGLLDTQMGGPEIPEAQGMTSPRRSLYFRLTPNEKMKFLELFDAADPNACYRRRESVVPQQALALLNSPLAFDATRTLAATLSQPADGAAAPTTDDMFVRTAFVHLLGRAATEPEIAACRRFLADQAQLAARAADPAFPATAASRVPPASDPQQRAREDLIQVLTSHNDYVTIR